MKNEVTKGKKKLDFFPLVKILKWPFFAKLKAGKPTFLNMQNFTSKP